MRSGQAGLREPCREGGADIAAARNGRNIVEGPSRPLAARAWRETPSPIAAERTPPPDRASPVASHGIGRGRCLASFGSTGSAGSGGGAFCPVATAAATALAREKTFSRSGGALRFAACPLAVAGKAGAAWAGATSERAAPGGGRTQSARRPRRATSRTCWRRRSSAPLPRKRYTPARETRHARETRAKP